MSVGKKTSILDSLNIKDAIKLAKRKKGNLPRQLIFVTIFLIGILTIKMPGCLSKRYLLKKNFN